MLNVLMVNYTADELELYNSYLAEYEIKAQGVSTMIAVMEKLQEY
jgi:hypothetical protein